MQYSTSIINMYVVMHSASDRSLKSFPKYHVVQCRMGSDWW